MIGVSILSCKNLENDIKKIDETNAEFLHVDVLDETYPKPFNPIEEVQKSNKNLNVHLMVKDQMKYIKEYEKIKPHSIVLEYELSNNLYDDISYLWKTNIKCGIAIAPETLVSDIKSYLSLVDYVLVLTVHPGLGGQKYLNEISYKIKLLKKLRKSLNLNFKIIVDGGINDKTIEKCKDADIFVVGSYITNSSDYQNQIDILRK